MKPSGYVLSEPAKPKVEVPGAPPTKASAAVAGALKSVLTLPKLAPAFTPTYQPVQLYAAGAGASGADVTAMSAAKAGVPTNAAKTAQVAIFFIDGPHQIRGHYKRTTALRVSLPSHSKQDSAARPCL